MNVVFVIDDIDHDFGTDSAHANMCFRTAIPNLDEAVVRLPTIRGSIPDPAQAILGCRYGPRCPVAIDQCHVEAPPLLPAGPARFARCPPRVVAP